MKRYESEYADDLKGLARKCPECGIIAHYEVKGKKPVNVECPNCENEFSVQKYKRGERPKSNVINLVDIVASREKEKREASIKRIIKYANTLDWSDP